MRIMTLAAVAVLGLASPALAAEPEVTVSYGPKLEKKLDEYGARDVDRLAEKLRQSVIRQTADNPSLDGARIELVLEDATPNRPTFQQMSDKPGLSYESFGVGGASISGRITLEDGASRPVSYRWYETDIRWAAPSGTWSDAERTFDQFARSLARNKDL